MFLVGCVVGSVGVGVLVFTTHVDRVVDVFTEAGVDVVVVVLLLHLPMTL